GTFSGQGVNNGMFDPSIGPNENGYTITYTVKADDPNACVTGEASSTFIITVNDPVTANAGTIADQPVCSDWDPINLADYLADSGATQGGTFSGDGVNNGMFDPSIGPNENGYTITYTVNADDPNACVTGEASSTFIITVNDPADAPVADAEQSFCLIDNPTVADIAVTGDNIVWYEDAELTTVADPADALVTGEDYYAVANSGDNACGSAATMVTVTINDAIAPTLKTDGDQFCRQDNPTVQNLIDNLNGTGIQIYASSTGGSPLATSTALINGTTYYASASDADLGCESTERLAITAAVNFCGIPEGFSPNGDNLNDRFVIPKIREDYPNFTLEIYNRWGNVVFKGNASTPDWDGVSNQSTTLGNDVVPAGVYFYILNYNDGQTEPVQGKLYLSR
ncbi:MAG: gliding motility-associated C-terminal domain-containing protein, partial [Gillisia sp.]